MGSLPCWSFLVTWSLPKGARMVCSVILSSFCAKQNPPRRAVPGFKWAILPTWAAGSRCSINGIPVSHSPSQAFPKPSPPHGSSDPLLLLPCGCLLVGWFITTFISFRFSLCIRLCPTSCETWKQSLRLCVPVRLTLSCCSFPPATWKNVLKFLET